MSPPPLGLTRNLVNNLWFLTGSWVPPSPLVDDAPTTPPGDPEAPILGRLGYLLAHAVQVDLDAAHCRVRWVREAPDGAPARLAGGGCAEDPDAPGQGAWERVRGDAPDLDLPPGFQGFVVRGEGLAEPVLCPVHDGRVAGWNTIEIALGPALCDEARSPAAELARDLRHSLTDRFLLFQTLEAFHRREWVQHVEALRRAVSDYAGRVRRDDLANLGIALRLAELARDLGRARPSAGVTDASLHEALEYLALAFSNAVFGVGWRRRDVHLVQRAPAGEGEDAELDGVATTRRIADAILAGVRALRPHVGAPTERRPRPASRLDKAEAAAWLLRQVDPTPETELPAGDPTPTLTAASTPAATLGPLLARWARQHEVLRHQVGGPPETAALDAICADSGRLLAAWLSWWSLDEAAAQRTQDHRPSHRTLLLLWFLHQLVSREAGAPGEPAPLRVGGRAVDLAYAMRELLRRAIFGRHRAHREASVELLEALARLIAFHAEAVLELPTELDLERQLTRIGAQHPGDATDHAMRHLEHVVEVYVASQAALLSEPLGRDRGAPRRSLAHHLSRSIEGARKGADRLRQATALAAIFHDTGLLLPAATTGPVARAEGVEEPELAPFHAFERARAVGVRELVRACRDELLRAKVVHEGQEPDIMALLEHLAERGEAHHAVAGAWYLFHQARRSRRLDPAVLVAAARAVLHHGLPGIRVHAGRDPAAAVLLLCDELFDWEPSRSGPDLGTRGGARAPVESPSRYRQVVFPLAFQVHADGTSRLLASRDPAGPDAHPLWVVSATLPPPAPLGAPPYHTWLSLAQDLGRIDWDGEQHFVPVLRLRSPHLVYGAHRVSVVDCLERALLEAPLPGGSRIREWLRAARVEGEADVDVLDIRSDPTPLFHDDVRLLLPELDRAFKRTLARMTGPG